jgi:hypothetical protein
VASQRSDLLRRWWNDGSEEVLRTLCSLDGFDHNDPLERDYYIAIARYEQLLWTKHRRVVLATYTRRQVRSVGVVQSICRQVLSSNKQSGLKVLRDADKMELSSENLVLRHPDCFSSNVVRAARSRVSI